MEQAACERRGFPDPAAALEELERVDREEDAALAAVPVDELFDLIVGGAPLEAALDREGEHCRRRRRGLGVDRVNHAVPELSGGVHRALVRPRDLRGEMEREDPLVLNELVVTGEEVARRRLRRAREFRIGPESLVELDRGDLDAVLEAVLTEADVERHDAPVREAARGVGKVGGRVEDDRGVRRGQVHAPAACSMAATISSSSSSLLRHATAPAERSAARWLSSADAVSATTRTVGTVARSCAVASAPSNPGIR